MPCSIQVCLLILRRWEVSRVTIIMTSILWVSLIDLLEDRLYQTLLRLGRPFLARQQRCGILISRQECGWVVLCLELGRILLLRGQVLWVIDQIAYGIVVLLTIARVLLQDSRCLMHTGTVMQRRCIRGQHWMMDHIA